jgi:hypothetical protein
MLNEKCRSDTALAASFKVFAAPTIPDTFYGT